MSDEMLRRAAARIRAEVAALPTRSSPADWDAFGPDVWAEQGSWLVAECSTRAEAQHIASWGPDIALDMAELLDRSAEAFDQCGFPAPEHEAAFPVVRIARKLLREEA